MTPCNQATGLRSRTFTQRTPGDLCAASRSFPLPTGRDGVMRSARGRECPESIFLSKNRKRTRWSGGFLVRRSPSGFGRPGCVCGPSSSGAEGPSFEVALGGIAPRAGRPHNDRIVKSLTAFSGCGCTCLQPHFFSETTLKESPPCTRSPS